MADAERVRSAETNGWPGHEAQIAHLEITSSHPATSPLKSGTRARASQIQHASCFDLSTVVWVTVIVKLPHISRALLPARGLSAYGAEPHDGTAPSHNGKNSMAIAWVATKTRPYGAWRKMQGVGHDKTNNKQSNVEGVNGIITYLAENLVSFNADELPLVVEMSGRQLASFEQFRREFASDLHNGFEHLVVAVASKEDLACVHLIKRAANRPHVDGIVVRNAQDDLWCSVESTD